MDLGPEESTLWAVQAASCFEDCPELPDPPKPLLLGGEGQGITKVPTAGEAGENGQLVSCRGNYHWSTA